MNILRTARILLAAIREQARAERAYLGNFWFGIISRVVYNIMFLIFIDVLYKRVGSIAGYSHNDFLFMFLLSQFGFYVTYSCINQTMHRLLQTVRTGNLDLVLLKPVPHRLFLYIQGLHPIDFLFTLLATLPLVGSMINWGDLALTPASLLIGAGVWLCGIIICNTLVFGLVLPAFKTGDATDALSIFYSISALGQLPYSKMPLFMKLLSLSVLPHLIISGATAEIILQKGDTIGIAASIAAATAISVVLYQYMWRYALRNYTSASS